MIDQLLERFGLKYEDLTVAEKETLSTMAKALETSPLTIEKLKDYLLSMRSAVEEELTRTTNNSKHDLFLKARLRNYMLIENIVASPERARRAIEEALANFKKTSVGGE